MKNKKHVIGMILGTTIFVSAWGIALHLMSDRQTRWPHVNTTHETNTEPVPMEEVSPPPMPTPSPSPSPSLPELADEVKPTQIERRSFLICGHTDELGLYANPTDQERAVTIPLCYQLRGGLDEDNFTYFRVLRIDGEWVQGALQQHKKHKGPVPIGIYWLRKDDLQTPSILWVGNKKHPLEFALSKIDTDGHISGSEEACSNNPTTGPLINLEGSPGWKIEELLEEGPEKNIDCRT